ncbi:MAG TPA: hypothetical protein VF112_06245 [Candidatus Dormibacteraeota bacterium]
MIDDIDRLDDALEGRSPSAALPERIGELVGVAAEVARALAVPVLTAEERERLYLRALHGRGWGRLRHELPRIARRHEVIGGAAAVTLAVVGIALLRGRSHPGLGGAAA